MRLSKPVVFLAVGAAIVWGVALGALVGRNSEEAGAAKATDFNPGRIIDDAVFFDKNSMSVAEIQSFLESHTPACDTWGTKLVGSENWSYASWTRADYAAAMRAQGSTYFHAPPYICLTNYYEHPDTHKTSFETEGKRFEGSMSAAEIIYSVAQEYGISPKVLLVVLKKEYGALFTDDWPVINQFNYVMGAGCPDNGPGWSANCDPKYKGFYRQMDYAGWLYDNYKKNIWNYNFQPNSWNTIQHTPDPSCGTQNVWIENTATALLYIYTPYVPNAGALAAYPGTAWCGAYGNRNFFMYYNEWFGSTYGGPAKKSDVFLPDDTYKLSPVENSGLSLDVVGNGSADGTAVQLYGDNNNSTAQFFEFISTGDGYYKIKHSGTNTFLTASSIGAGQANVYIWSEKTDCSQKWSIAHVANEQYEILSSCYGQTMGATDIVQWGRAVSDGASSQVWTLRSTKGPAVDDSQYRIVAGVGKNKLLEISGNKSDNGTKVQINKLKDDDAQRFALERTTDGFYMIKHVGSGKYVDVVGRGTANYTAVHLYAGNQSCAQKWVLRPIGEKYSLLSACSGLALDVYAGSSENGTNVQIYKANESKAQQWFFQKEGDVEYSTFDGVYTIKTVAGKALDVYGGSIGVERTNVWIFNDNGSNAQKWVIEEVK